jgi:hypothetical protein
VLAATAMSGGGRSSLQGGGEACGEERKMVAWKLSFFSLLEPVKIRSSEPVAVIATGFQ